MSDEYTGPGRDASASTDGSRPVQHPVAAYAGASAPADPGTHPGAGCPAGPPPGDPYGPGAALRRPVPGRAVLRRPALQRPAAQRPAHPAQPAARRAAGAPCRHRGRGADRRPGRWRRRVRRRLRAGRRRTPARSSPPRPPARVPPPRRRARWPRPPRRPCPAPSTCGCSWPRGSPRAAAWSSPPTATCSPTTTWSPAPGTISVTLSDGSEHPATVVGTAPSYDLAVIKLQGVSGLTPATLGQSSTCRSASRWWRSARRRASPAP